MVVVVIVPEIPFPSDTFTVPLFPAKLIFPINPLFKFAVPVLENTIFELVVDTPSVLKFPIPVPIFVVVAIRFFSKFVVPAFTFTVVAVTSPLNVVIPVVSVPVLFIVWAYTLSLNVDVVPVVPEFIAFNDAPLAPTVPVTVWLLLPNKLNVPWLTADVVTLPINPPYNETFPSTKNFIESVVPADKSTLALNITLLVVLTSIEPAFTIPPKEVALRFNLIFPSPILVVP